MKRNALIIGIAIATALGLSCGKKKSNDDSGASGSVVEGVDNQLAAAYPGGLAISVFPTEATSLTAAATPRSLKKKHEEGKKVLNGEGGKCQAAGVTRFILNYNEQCYHFDQDMIKGKSPAGAGFGTANGKDYENDEACLVSFARTEVEKIEAIVDRRLGLMQSMLCQAKKDDGNVALPGVGETLNLKPALDKAVEGIQTNRPVVSTATIKRLADQDGRPVYRYDVVFTKAGKSREFYVVHSPKSESDNNEYRGVMWSKSDTGETNMKRHLSIRYALEKDGETRYLAGELLRANLHTDLQGSAFNKGVLDLNSNADFDVAATDANYGKYKKSDGNYFDNQNQAATAMTYVSFKLNLEDNSGTTSYWRNPGAEYGENARGMVFKITNGDAGMKGCGTSGAAGTMGTPMSIRKKLKGGTDTKLKAVGFYHPFFHTGSGCTVAAGDPGFDHKRTCSNNGTDSVYQWKIPDTTTGLKDTWAKNQAGTIITEQCVKLSNGKYLIDTEKTTSSAGFDLIDHSADGSKSIVSPDIETMLGTFERVE